MAGLIVTNVDTDVAGDVISLRLDCLFHSIGLKDLSVVSVDILSTDSLATIKQKVVDALTAEATRLGYFVPASNMILPAFQKGA